MTKRSCCLWAIMGLISVMASGCCCIQGTNVCNSCSSCPSGTCGAGPLMGLASCRSGCGEVYVDEWVSHPPCIDNCGYADGACGCRQPLRSALRALWGTPYIGDCCNSGCDSGACDAGCSSCGGGAMVSGGHSSNCNCGGQTTNHSMSTPSMSAPPTHAPAATPTPAVQPESVPTPAPVTPSSAKRLSPAKQRATMASHR